MKYLHSFPSPLLQIFRESINYSFKMSLFILIQILRFLFIFLLFNILPVCGKEKEIHFNRNVTGIVFSPNVLTFNSSTLSQKQEQFDPKLNRLKAMLKGISRKFSKVVVFGSDDLNKSDKFTLNQTDYYNYSVIYTAKAAAMLNKESNKHLLKITVGIMISENSLLVNNSVQIAFNSVKIANSIYSNTITGIVVYHPNLKDYSILSKVLISLKLIQDIKLGTKQNCEDLEKVANGIGENTEQETLQKDMLLNSDFIICEVFQNGINDYAEKVIEKLGHYNDYLQVIKPGIQLIGLTGYPTNQHADKERMKVYWQEMNKFAESNQNNISILMQQAFDQPWKNIDGNYGWWKVGNNAEMLSENGYIEKISEQIYKPSNLTETQISNSSDSAYYWLCGGVLFLALILLLIHWVEEINIKIRDRKNILTTKQIQHFRHGVPTINKKEEGAIHYNALRYDKAYEIDKENLQTIKWNTPIKTSDFTTVQIAKLKFEIAKEKLIEYLTVALKTTRPNCPKHALLNILREIKLLSYLGPHDHLVLLIGANTQEIHNGVVYMVTEMCCLGSLKNYLKDNCPILEENWDKFWGKFKDRKDNIKLDKVSPFVTFDDMLRWSHEIACGMDYLSSKNIIHGNLAASNVLLTGEKKAKISGFGKSRSNGIDDNSELSVSFGANRDSDFDIALEDVQYKRWMALESIKRGIFCKQSDVWMYGVTLWEIFSFGETPYIGPEWLPNYLEKLAVGLRLERPYLANTDMYNLMFVCWAKRPKDRPKFTNLKYVTALLLEIFRTKRNENHVPTKLFKLIYPNSDKIDSNSK